MSQLLKNIGNSLVEKKYLAIGKAVKNAGSLMRFGVFAWNANREGIAETTATVINGAISQTVVEKVGTFVVNRYCHK